MEWDEVVVVQGYGVCWHGGMVRIAGRDVPILVSSLSVSRSVDLGERLRLAIVQAADYLLESWPLWGLTPADPPAGILFETAKDAPSSGPPLQADAPTCRLGLFCVTLYPASWASERVVRSRYYRFGMASIRS